MTYQLPEQLVVAGEAMAMYTDPLGSFMERPGQRIAFRHATSAVRRGYLGRWEIDADGRLMLKGFDPAQSSVWSLTPLASGVAGWMALTQLPDGAPYQPSFGSVRQPVSPAFRVVPEADAPMICLRHRHIDLVVRMRADDAAAWPDGDELALETSRSYFALLGGRRDPQDPPQAWGSGGEPGLRFEDFVPVVGADEIALDRLANVMVAHRPIEAPEPPWASRYLSRVTRAGRRTTLSGASAYQRTSDDVSRVDLRDCLWWQVDGHHEATIRDVDPDAREGVHGSWFDGQLRVVRDDDAHRAQISQQSRIYTWDPLAFDGETRLQIEGGHVIAVT